MKWGLGGGQQLRLRHGVLRFPRCCGDCTPRARAGDQSPWQSPSGVGALHSVLFWGSSDEGLTVGDTTLGNTNVLVSQRVMAEAYTDR